MTPPEKPKYLAFIGFGEATTAFLSGWGPDRPAEIAAYDIKSDAAATRSEMAARYAEHRVTGAAGPVAAVAGSEVVFSVVTADQAEAAALASAPGLARNAIWLDCNSCAPDTKRAAAEVIEAAGGRYVDVAVMAPVHPKRHLVPILVSGPHAEDACAIMRALGMRPEIAGDRIGQASTIKMLRSVMIKGLEALSAECFLAARRAGVDAEVLASLEASEPDIAWRRRGTYSLERMLVHGVRRAAEMEEVAKTVAALGLPDGMSRGAVTWQTTIAATGAEPGEDRLESRADRILDAL